MSTSRLKRREHKPKSKGIVPLHERKVKKSMQNEGGFYEGMPGVTIDELGHRKIIDFIVTDKGYETARVYAHPKIIKGAVQNACANNKELNSIILGSAVDSIFQRNTPLHFVIRFGLMLKRHKAYKKMQRRQKEAEKELKVS